MNISLGFDYKVHICTRRFILLFYSIFIFLCVSGCKVEVYKGLTEDQVNEMLAVLIYRGIDAEKLMAGKLGFSLLVAEDQLVQALEILKKSAFPRETYASIGEIFSGQGMVTSQSEERLRMAFAISQELANTFSRVDGVLTTRVHVVPGYIDQAADLKVLPSMGIFIRHTPESPIVNMLPGIREVAAKSLPGLEYDRTAVMLVPVQEPLTVPTQGGSTFLGLSLFPDRGMPYFLILAIIVFISVGIGTFIGFSIILLQRSVSMDKKFKKSLNKDSEIKNT